MARKLPYPLDRKRLEHLSNFHHALVCWDKTYPEKAAIVGCYNEGALRRICDGGPQAIARMELGRALRVAQALGFPLLGDTQAEHVQNLDVLCRCCDVREASALTKMALGRALLHLAVVEASPREAVQVIAARSGQPSSVWQGVTWDRPDLRKEFVDLYAAAREIVTCHDRLDAWMMPDDMYDLWQQTHLIDFCSDGRELGELIASNNQHRQNSLHAREHSDYRIQILAAPETFRWAADQKVGREWPGELGNTAIRWGKHKGLVSLSVALEDRWKDVRRTVQQELGLPSWHKLAVIDHRIAAYWPSPKVYFFTEEASVVRKFEATLTACHNDAESPRTTACRLRSIAEKRI